MGRGAGHVTGPLRGATIVTLALVALARPVLAENAAPSGPAIPVPSGVEVRWLETLSDTQGPEGLTLRFRFVAPQVAGPGYDPDKAATDMQALCDTFALPRLSDLGPQPAQVVIALADRVVPYGEIDEEAVQFFEAYSVADGSCVWELF